MNLINKRKRQYGEKETEQGKRWMDFLEEKCKKAIENALYANITYLVKIKNELTKQVATEEYLLKETVEILSRFSKVEFDLLLHLPYSLFRRGRKDEPCPKMMFIKHYALKPDGIFEFLSIIINTYQTKNVQRKFGYHTSKEKIIITLIDKNRNNLMKESEKSEEWVVRPMQNSEDHRDNNIPRTYFSPLFHDFSQDKYGKYLYIVSYLENDNSISTEPGPHGLKRASSLEIIAELNIIQLMNECFDFKKNK